MFEPLLQSNIQLITAEEDVRRYFGVGQKLLNTKRINVLFKIMVISALTVSIIFIALNAPAFWIKSKYILTNDIMNSNLYKDSPTNLPLPGQVASAAIVQETIPSLSNNYIYIDRIGVKAPINWGVTDNNDIIMSSLKNGVVNLDSTAKPGERGNVFIVGHSSNYSFAKGKYKTVFALLPELVIGDNILIQYNNNTLRYRVNEIKVVYPDDVSVKEKGKTPQLTLMN